MPINEVQLLEPGYEVQDDVEEMQPVPFVKQVDMNDLHSALEVAVTLSSHPKFLQLPTTPVS